MSFPSHFRVYAMTIQTIRAFLFASCAVAAPFVHGADRPGDEPLNPEAAAFYAVPPLGPRTNSAAVGLVGLTAPSGEDFMAYGRKTTAEMFIGTDKPLPEQDDKSRRLEINWNQDRMNCWTDDYEPFDRDPQCAPIEEAIRTLEANQEIRSRYRQILKLEPASRIFPATYGHSFILLTKLTLVEAKVALRQGRSEAAYRLWADQHAFLRRMISCGGTWVETAILMVNEGLSLSFAESMLHNAPQLIGKHFEELSKLLAPESITRFNFPEMARSQHDMLQWYVDHGDASNILYPNFISNWYYRYAIEIMELTSLPAGKLDEREKLGRETLRRLEVAKIEDKYMPSAEFFKSTQLIVPFSIIKAMHGKNRVMNLLTMRLRVYKDKVPDAEIPAYLLKNAANLREPFNDSPMQWSPTKRTLFYENMKYGGALEARL